MDSLSLSNAQVLFNGCLYLTRKNCPLANSKVVRHCHAVKAGIFVKEPGKTTSLVPKKKRRRESEPS